MSRSAEVDLFFGEGRFTFALKIGELIQIEENRSLVVAALGLPLGEASIERIMARLAAGAAMIGEVKEVHRLALIGGGMDKPQAYLLVERHVAPPHMKEAAQRAYAILAAAWVGVPDDAPGKKPGRAKVAARSPSPTAGSAGPSSSAPARRSASPRKPSRA